MQGLWDGPCCVTSLSRYHHSTFVHQREPRAGPSARSDVAPGIPESRGPGLAHRAAGHGPTQPTSSPVLFPRSLLGSGSPAAAPQLRPCWAGHGVNCPGPGPGQSAGVMRKPRDILPFCICSQRVITVIYACSSDVFPHSALNCGPEWGMAGPRARTIRGEHEG